jgi:DNA polymerase/3'-5' exonuclease PolX
MSLTTNELLMYFTTRLKKNAFLSAFFILLFSISGYSQTKELNLSEQIESLISSYERISISEVKLQIIAERTANIPAEELALSEIPDLIQKYSNEIEREERQVISIEHYLKSVNATVEMPFGRFSKLSSAIKIHVQNDPMYVITNPSN